MVVGAHYDTKDIPGFVGANDGASGTAVVAQLARTIRRPRHTIQFVFFDGEEAPRGTPDGDFEEEGLRGSRVARQRFARRGRWCCSTSWATAASRSRARTTRTRRSGAACGAPPGAWVPALSSRTAPSRPWPTTTSPSSAGACPSIDLIDFSFPCFHRRCDNMSAVSERSVDLVGETVLELLREL